MIMINMDIPAHGCYECPMKHDAFNGSETINVCYAIGEEVSDDGTRPDWCPLKDVTIGKWKQLHGYITPGGTPLFVCPKCGGSEHLHGVEYPQRRVVCKDCGQINVYPWEKTYDEEE